MVFHSNMYFQNQDYVLTIERNMNSMRDFGKEFRVYFEFSISSFVTKDQI